MVLAIIVVIAAVLAVIVLKAFFAAAKESPVRTSRSWKHEDVSKSPLDR